MAKALDKWKADVVVIGGGLAGFCAAIEAVQAGAEVLMLEKESEVGGSTVLSGGSTAFAGTELQEQAGIKDSDELLYKDMRAAGNYDNDERMVRVYVDNQLDTFRWLCQRGVPFGPIQLSSGQSVPRVHPTRPRELMALLTQEAQVMNGFRLQTSAPAKRLLQKTSDSAVAGLIVELAGRPIEVTARRGVVLTSGGFSRSPEMIKRFAPLLSRAICVGAPGNTGDGLKMAWRLGADLRDMGYIKGTFGNHPKASSTEHTALMAVYKGAMAVNRNAERFVDESIPYKQLGDAVLQQPNAVGYQIFDQNIMDQAVPGVLMFDYNRRLEQGYLHKGTTLAELANKIDVPADKLAATLAEYNAYVERGRDERYGRTGLSMGTGKLVKLDRAPFYAYPSTSAVVATYCGLVVDPEMRVLDVFGEAIRGLYAAGEITSGFHGSGFMTGSSLTKAAICGRIGGRNAARYIR